MNQIILNALAAGMAVINIAQGVHAHESMWQIAFNALCFAVLIGAAFTEKRRIERKHHLALLRAFDMGRSSIVREQVEMQRRSQP